MNLKKGSAAFVASLMFFNCTVFGAGLVSLSSSNENAIIPVVKTTEEEVPKRVITYEEAVELAIKNNSSLGELEDKLEALEESEEQLGYALGLQTMPGVPGSVYMDSATVNLLSTLTTVQNGIKTIEDSKRIAKESCELIVKSYMAEIIGAENNFEMMKANLEMSRENTYFNRLKYDMGMLSETEFIKAINDNKTVEQNYRMTELLVENAYNKLGNIIGVRNEKFVIEYEPVYEKYPEQANIIAFANKMADMSPTLKIADRTVEEAEFNMRVVAIDNGKSYDERDRELNAAGRNYNDTRNALLLAVKNGYITVKQAEANIETLKMTLENTQKQYDNAVISRELGYITDVELMGAKLALTKAEGDVKTAILNHDMAKFMLDHPYLSASSGSASQQK